MLDIGWTEILIIAVITLFVVGPKDIPKVLRTIGIWIGKFKSISRDFQNTLHDAVKEAELDEVKKQIESAHDAFDQWGVQLGKTLMRKSRDSNKLFNKFFHKDLLP